MNILLIAEHRDNALSEQTSKALSAAMTIGSAVHILVAGEGVEVAARVASTLAGVEKVLVADTPSLAHQLPEAMTHLIMSIVGDYDVVMAPATSSGKSLMPRVAALLDVMQISEVMEVIDASTFRRPIYAGNAIQTVRSEDTKKVLTIRTASFPVAPGSGSAAIEAIAVPEVSPRSHFVEEIRSQSGRPELSSARVVVSGGRALGSKDKFDELILPLADKLGAAVGASRAAVDAGYAPNDWQVGQTGKVVAPELYIACGISGAIQHVAGMQEAKVVVAINKDSDAPIFQAADYGLVADLFDALPKLEQALSVLPSPYQPV